MTRLIQNLGRELASLFRRRGRYCPEKHYLRGRPSGALNSRAPGNGGART